MGEALRWPGRTQEAPLQERRPGRQPVRAEQDRVTAGGADVPAGPQALTLLWAAFSQGCGVTCISCCPEEAHPHTTQPGAASRLLRGSGG